MVWQLPHKMILPYFPSGIFREKAHARCVVFDQQILPEVILGAVVRFN